MNLNMTGFVLGSSGRPVVPIGAYSGPATGFGAEAEAYGCEIRFSDTEIPTVVGRDPDPSLGTAFFCRYHVDPSYGERE